jgi:hypothetical protein
MRTGGRRILGISLLPRALLRSHESVMFKGCYCGILRKRDGPDYTFCSIAELFIVHGESASSSYYKDS